MRPLYLLIIAMALQPAANLTAQDQIRFSRDIRPILSNNCFQCHGPDPLQRQTDLRLDTPESALARTDGRAAFVPGDLENSEAYQRITSTDDLTRMPPPDSGKSLTPQQIELVRKWIEQGANWSQHWAFVPPERPPLPDVENSGWVRNPLDRFVLARLEKEGLHPSPEADKTTLLRRLSLDLIGLPPTIDQTDAFLADDRPDAYERQVERLLDSPHYGERWGRHWLDAARYADSDGYEKDKARQVWFYRDWVVDALNSDLPYDRFIIEQLAGDLLPAATQDQVVATGFLRNSMTNEEGGVDPEQFRMEAMFDRMDAVGKSILGLTIQCAQCHSHKYDPLTQEEYYRMFAFLNNSHEANSAVYTPDQQQRRGEMFRQIGEIEARLKHENPDWNEQMAAWEETARGNQPDWHVITPFTEDMTTGGQKYFLQPDGSLLAQGYAPTKFVATFRTRVKLKKITAVRLELLNHPNLPLGGPGRSIQGTAALTEFHVDAAPADQPREGEAPAEPPAKKTRHKIARATADVALPEKPLAKIYDDNTDSQRVTGPVEYAIDGKDLTAWGIDAGPGRRNRPRKAVFTLEKPIASDGESLLTFSLTQKHGGWNSDDNQNHNLGRFRISITDAENAAADPLPQRVREILSIPGEQRTPAQTAALFRYWRTTVPEWKDANERIEALWQMHPEGTSQLVLDERDRRRKTSILERGNFLKPQQQVQPGVPEFLHPMPENAPRNRLGFARWLVDAGAPTTARAVVNRLWQTYWGTGLVATSEDLGMQGEAPSHPELLDWLSVEFMQRGWSLKQLHRLIVTSAAYRQSSRVSGALAARDPFNRLLARGPRVRVEGEIVRDIALAAGGLLYPRMSGESVYPPAPDFLFEPPASYGPKVWNEQSGPDRYRRSLYTFRYRSVPYPPLQAFDTPNGDFSCVRRARSNTPLQALTTLNETLFVESARSLALITLREACENNRDRLTYAFRRCLTRAPTDNETEILLDLYQKQLKRFQEGELNPWKLAAGTPEPETKPDLPNGATPAELAAWTAVARVLLNLDETITKE